MEKIKISTVWKSSKSNKSEGTVYLRVKLMWSNEAGELFFSSREEIKKSQFKGGPEPIRGNSRESLGANSRIRETINHIYDLFLEYRNFEDSLTKDGFKAWVNSRVFCLGDNNISKKVSLSNLFERYLVIHNHELGQSRKKRYSLVKRKVCEFCQSINGSKDFDARNLTREFQQRFRNFLYEQGKYSNDTLNNYQKVLDAVVRDAYKSELIEKFPFVSQSYRYSEPKIRYLSEVDLNKIETTIFEDSREQMVADVFIFAAHTGLSHTDLFSLKSDDIEKINNVYSVTKKRNKTDTTFSTVIDQTAYQILKKYKNDPYCITNKTPLRVLHLNEYNELLKRIQIRCGIKMKLTSHVARHTMATNYLNNGGTPDVLQPILGHENILTTMRYAKVKTKKIIDQASVVMNLNYDSQI